MHALSLPTWWIHITSVLEWMAAMLAVQRLARRSGESAWHWLALAMLPALVSAMCACTWHLYDNSAALRGLVVLQAGTHRPGQRDPGPGGLEPEPPGAALIPWMPTAC